ncbi:TPA: hypothetical protein ACRL2B_004468 [Pseudomonas aeruginosa]|nr:hypothetical protein [Salmonella enterica]QCM14306.1 hypothetical protein CFBP6625_28300 [Agrobacterium tumefaciens]
MKIEDLKGDERTLVVVALQALHTERVNAYSAACTACDLAGRPSPDRNLFGLDEVNDALRRIGAAPMR